MSTIDDAQPGGEDHDRGDARIGQTCQRSAHPPVDDLPLAQLPAEHEERQDADGARQRERRVDAGRVADRDRQQHGPEQRPAQQHQVRQRDPEARRARAGTTASSAAG